MTNASLRSRLIRLGNFFFRHRSLTPIPFMLFLIVCRWRESGDLVTWVPGLIFLVLGEGLRLWGVAVVGKESRTRGGGGAQQLVAYGPYAWVRNPLYLGNLFLTVGATLISELLWVLPVVLVLFVIQYVPIVLWEESILSERFGPEYTAYCQRVPRWFPCLPQQTLSPQGHPFYQWRVSFWSERSTLGTLALLVLLMIAKENLPHLPKYLQTHHIVFSEPGQ